MAPFTTNGGNLKGKLFCHFIFQLMENGQHGEPSHNAQKAAVQVPRLRREHAPTQVLITEAYRAADQPPRHKPAILSTVKLRQHTQQPQL